MTSMLHSEIHTNDRLARREINLTADYLNSVAQNYSEDTAVVLGKRVSSEGMRYGYELVILIVRGKRPVTVMTRRQSQNFDKRNFNVSKVVYL